MNQKHNLDDSLKLVSDVGSLSIRYEMVNTRIKTLYMMYEVLFLSRIFNSLEEHAGTFGTGYPYYVLGEDFLKKCLNNLPIIDEQIRYGNELIQLVNSYDGECWPCYNCLKENYVNMPNLKFKCKPCTEIPDELKPRKVINRLPDIDLWFIAKDNCLMSAQSDLLHLFSEFDLRSSDVNPLDTINDMKKIVELLECGIIPFLHLPLDIHIIENNSLKNLIEKIPEAIEKHNLDLKIFPYSLRKDWNYDVEGYNFIHDFLFSFSIINANSDLKNLVNDVRNYLSSKYDFDALYGFFEQTAAPSTLRRCKTRALKDAFKERVESWRK